MNLEQQVYELLPHATEAKYTKVYLDHDEDLGRRARGEQVVFTRQELIEAAGVISAKDAHGRRKVV